MQSIRVAHLANARRGGRWMVESCASAVQTLPVTKRTKRQHLTAVSYLRRFADANGRITVHDKRSGSEFTTNIINIEVESNFYTVPDANGQPSDVVEKSIATDVEAPAVVAFDALVNDAFPLPEEQRVVVAKFLALQLCRGVAFREMHGRLAEKHAGKPIRPRDELTPEENAELQRVAGPAFLALATSQAFRMDTMFEIAENAIPHLLERPWILVRTSDAPTGDLPVIPWHQESKTAGFGIGLSAATEIEMAISPERLLVLGPRTGSPLGGRVVDASDEVRRQFPRLVRSSARRYVYRRPGSAIDLT